MENLFLKCYLRDLNKFILLQYLKIKHFKERVISEGGRLTSDIFKIFDNLKIKASLIRLGIEKAFGTSIS